MVKNFILSIVILFVYHQLMFSQTQKSQISGLDFIKNNGQIADREIQKQDLVNAQEMQQPNTSCFIKNEGQIGDGEGQLHPEVLFKSSFNDVTMFFKNDGIVYLFNKYEKIPTEESRKARNLGEFTLANVLETKPMMFRMDLQFINTNPNVTVNPSNERPEVSNYYLGHCPKGVLDVKHFNKITYKNLYQNIDVVYYFTENGLKYDIIVNTGGNISDIKFRYEGAGDVSVSSEEELIITYADGQKLIEEKPLAFFQNEEGINQNITFSLDKTSGIIGFTGEDEIFQKTLIIDPSITWATYFHNTNSANSGWSNPEYDANGNFFFANQTYDDAFPLANPGGGAYYDATKTTMIKVAILKFNANRTLIWSTYYGGDEYNCLAGCTDYGKSLALDNSGNVYVAGYTVVGTTIFPTYDPGVGAFYQDQSKCYGETSFFLKFNNNGVRLWATMFTHETASTSGTMIRVNGITCDGSNLYFTGQQYDWTPANTIPLRNPGSGAHYQSSILGTQDVFVGRFSSTQSLYWCTYLHSTNPANTAFGQGLDLHCDASGNLFLTGRESGANSHHYLINPGGSTYYQGTKGANGDLFITKFNTSLTAVWGTYYGGDGMDIPSTVEPDSLGNIYIIGRYTASTDFPTQDPGSGALYQGAKSNANCDGFLLKFDTSCVRQWATYLGANVPSAGSDENHFSGIAFNKSNNNVFISGYTKSTVMTTVNQGGSYNQAANAGDYDMFFYEFNSSGVVQWASYYGKSLNELSYNGRLGYYSNSCGIRIVTPIASASTNLTGVDPGNGAWYQGTTSFAWNDFLMDFGTMTTTLPVSVSIAASANPICAGTDVTFTATPANGGTPSYQWYLNGNPVGTDSSTYSNSSLAGGDQVYCVMTSSLTCITGSPATSNTITMTVNTNSTAPTSISASTNPICPDSSTTLTVNGGSLGTGASWQWYSGSCGGTFVGTGTSVLVSPASNTTYYVLASGTCNTTTCALLTVNVNTNPTATAGSNSAICDGEDLNLTETGGDATSWSWTGPDSFSSTSQYPTISPATTAAAGVYTVIATDINGCTDTDNVIVTVNDLPVTDAGPDSTISYGASIILYGTASGGSGSYSYSWSPADSLVDPLIEDPTTINLHATTVFTLTVTDDVTGCQNTAQVIITVTGGVLSVNATAIPQTICYGDSTQLEAIASGGSGTYTYFWTSVPDGFYSTVFNPVVSPVTTTTYIVIVYDGTNTDTSVVTVTVNTLPTADAGTDVSICEGSTTTLTATGGGSYKWSTSDSIAVIIVQPSDTTIYTVTVTNSCGNDYDSVVVFVNPLPIVDLGDDMSISADTTIILNAGNPGASYIWSTGDITQTITVSEEGTYSVTVTDNNGCSNTGSITITMENLELIIYNVFTPNGDDVNDTWVIENIEFYKDSYIEIYNRNGNLVFSAEHYQNDWDGKYNAQDLPAATYYYIIALGENYDKTYKGFVTIIR